MPGMASLTNGDIPSKRKMTATMLEGFYQSTFSPDSETGKEFAADAIISNPPAFAHVHVAEALGLPLLISFSESNLTVDSIILVIQRGVALSLELGARKGGSPCHLTSAS